MKLDDIIYLCLLLFCIGFGHFYRKINRIEQKKWIGTIVGIFIVFVVSGFHTFHIVICYVIGVIVILYVDVR